MKKMTVFASAILVAAASFAQTWSLDKTHAKLGFGVSHLMVSETEGNFKTFEAKITSSKADFTDAVIDLTADVNSINTDVVDRDNHLKSPDFFDAAKFPTITFKSKSFVKADAKNYKLTGDLTMHGVTKPVVLDVIFNGTAIHPYNKKTVAGFKVKGMLKRADFALSPNTPGAVVGDDIALTANMEFFKD
ncbi:MAG: YceI family protein [Cytophagales bacterium]